MKIFFNLLLLSGLINFLYSLDREDKSIYVRILIKSKCNKIEIKTSGNVYVKEEKTGEKFLLMENSEYEIKPFQLDFIMLSGEKLTSPIIIENSSPNGYIIVDGKKYRGRFKIKNEGSQLDIIEYIDIERYLWGVLGPEMGESWPIEALKAQAVAARTYALASLNPSGDYDMSDTTNHQVYTGFENVSPQLISAVNQTRGEVLTYKDKVFFAYYHANSGGHTTTPSGVWNGDIIPPLKGVKDPYSKNSTHYKWSVYISNSTILKFLSLNGYKASKIRDIRIYSKDRSQRAVKLIFKTDRENIKVETREFRNFVGNFEMKSTLITSIVKIKDGFKITGRGWGHGVGLSQDGAKEMADRGADYRKILKFYYPKAVIKDMEDVIYGG